MKTQIPIYRAKKIGSDEYVEGFLSPNDKESKQWCIGTINEWKVFKIDPSTLAIHFPDMIDSEGTKIFASLSKDGKGGDTYRIQDEYNPMGTNTIIYRDTTFVFIINEGSFAVKVIKRDSTFEDKDTSAIGNYHVGMVLAGHRKPEIKVTGIQQ